MAKLQPSKRLKTAIAWLPSYPFKGDWGDYHSSVQPRSTGEMKAYGFL